MKRIALATSAKLPTLNEDDRLLIPALAERGLAAVPAVWDAPDVCWEEFQGVVVRSCWDYHHRLEEFLTWVARLERAGIPVNGPSFSSVAGSATRSGSGQRRRTIGCSGSSAAPPRPWRHRPGWSRTPQRSWRRCQAIRCTHGWTGWSGTVA